MMTTGEDKYGASNYLKEYFKKVYENRSSNFANGRAVRNLF